MSLAWLKMKPNKISLQSSCKLNIIDNHLSLFFASQQWYNQILPNVISWHHNQRTLSFSSVNEDASLAGAKLVLAGFIRKQLWAVVRVETAFPCISQRVLVPSRGEVPIVLFIQYQRCRCLNLNKEGHWTELSVWLPFRTAVNAILLIQLLKAPLPARSLCEGNTMQAVQMPQKGIALESHTSTVWPLLCWGGRLNPRGHPVSSSRGRRIDSKSVTRGAHDSEHPGKWQLIVFAIYTNQCSVWVAETPTELWKIHEPVSHTWISLRYESMWTNGRKCFTGIIVCTHIHSVIFFWPCCCNNFLLIKWIYFPNFV